MTNQSKANLAKVGVTATSIVFGGLHLVGASLAAAATEVESTISSRLTGVSKKEIKAYRLEQTELIQSKIIGHSNVALDKINEFKKQIANAQ